MDMSSKEDIRKAVIEATGASIEMVDSKVRFLRKRLKKVKHLPEMPDVSMLEMFLIMNKFDIDVSQKKIEKYYQVRTDYPEIFRNKNPILPHMIKVADVIYLVTLPKLTPELYRVNFLKMKDASPSNLYPYDFVGHMLNCMELNLARRHYAAGELFIYDLDGASLRHLFKFGMSLIRKLSRVLQEVYSPKMRGIHFVNCPIFIDAILKIARAVLKEKLADRIKVHTSEETLKEFVPEYLLPKDYGGQGEYLDILRKKQKEQFVKYVDRFNILESLEKIEIFDSNDEK